MRKNPAMDAFLGLDSSETLMHSEEYLGAEYDEGLQHWKYLKKYKNSNGKWTYVYADKKTHQALNSAAGQAKQNFAVGQATGSGEHIKRGFEHLENYNKALDEADAIKNLKKNLNPKGIKKAYAKSYKDAVAKGTAFIEKLLGKTENYYPKAKRPRARQKDYSGNSGGAHRR